MGQLTNYLQEQFRAHCPSGWDCRPEARLLNEGLASILGYAPRADVLFVNQLQERRLWIEFEVSRADPVANHVKFATSHLFQPQGHEDFFVAMVSRHVERGRRNLAANTIHLMRMLGMNAVQTVLLPGYGGMEIQHMNHQSREALRVQGPDVMPEIERVFAVTTPQASSGNHRVYFAGELIDVLLNARTWNSEVRSSQGRSLWGRRRVRYFVFVPYSGEFAPSKFCAFLPAPPAGSQNPTAVPWRMGLNTYAALDESESRFDGHLAHNHLTRRLGMVTRKLEESTVIAQAFHRWLSAVTDLIVIDRLGPLIICPPDI
jgi:hypothetical protein